MTCCRIPLIAAALLLAACGGSQTGSGGAEAGGGSGSVEQGEALIEQGEFGEAAALFEQLVAADPANARAQYYLGYCRENLGDVDAAISQYRLAIGYDANLTEAHSNLGILLLAQGDLTHAEAELHTALKQRPDESAAHYDYGLVLEEMGRTAEAREHYEKAVELDPEDPAPLIGIADIARADGDLDRALDHYRRAAGLAPENPLLVIQEAQVLFELKRPDDGTAALRRLAGMSGAKAADLTSAGILAGRHGQGALAIELYQAALELDETYALAHLYWANALGRKKQFEQAVGHFERFIELAPDAAEAESARKGLAACRAKLGQ